MKKRFVVSGTVRCWTIVYADSKEEALKIAATRELAKKHHSYTEPELFHVESMDEPQNLVAEATFE